MDIKIKAKEFAIKAHQGQVRKSDKEKPMIMYPINVACILEKFGFDENVIAAGYLHDVVEDTKYTIEDIKKEFGEDVASLVYGASEPDKTKSWEDRKLHTINESSKLDLRHKAVVVADKINNLEDLELLINSDENFTFDNFNRGYEQQKWYYTTLCNEICKNESHEIFNRLKDVVDRVFNDKKDIALKYLDEDNYNKLLYINCKKYQIKNMLNCLDNKPYVIEFTGTPRTGKTSIINNIEDFFKKAGFKVKVLEEFTTSLFYKNNIKPKLLNEYKNVVNTEIPKYVNIQLDEAINNGYDIILIDRSLFDRCIWIDRLSLKGGISELEVSDYYDKYIPMIKEKIDLVIATYCDTLTSLKRDYISNLSLEKRGFLNEDNVNEYNNSLKNTINLFKTNDYEVNLFDTNSVSMKDTEYDIIKYILNNMEVLIKDKLKRKYDI